jgi:hypothetical protein
MLDQLCRAPDRGGGPRMDRDQRLADFTPSSSPHLLLDQGIMVLQCHLKCRSNQRATLR